MKLFDPYISPDADLYLTEVLTSGWVGTGPKVELFEKKFAEYVGAEHAVAVTSGTAALHLAVCANDFSLGAEVITTPMTFVSTNHVLLYEGLTPVFVDIDNDTLNIDLDKVEEAITPKTEAIMVVHYAGNPVDRQRLYTIADENNLSVIEDAAHACGAVEPNGIKIGRNGTVCFSFQAVKNLCTGDGGMICTDDLLLYERLKSLRWMGISSSTYDRLEGGYKWEYLVEDVGFKYAMNDITAAIGLAQLEILDVGNEFRRCISNMYRSELSELDFVSTTEGSANHIVVMRLPSRNATMEALLKKGIETGVHYKPNYHYPMYEKFVGEKQFPVTERAYSEILSLPCHLRLSENEVQKVINEIRRIHNLHG